MTPEELTKLPIQPELPTGRTADVNQIAQTVMGSENIPQPLEANDGHLPLVVESPAEPGKQMDRSVDVLQSQAHAAEIAQPNEGAHDLPKPDRPARYLLTSKQAPEEQKRAIITAIQECARKLGTTPSFHKMNGMTGIGMHRIERHFGGYNAALGACGLEPHDAGRPRTMEELFEDWAEVARKIGKAPTRAQFDRHGRNSPRPLMRIFHSWSAIPEGMRQYALEHGLEGAWRDVIGITELEMKSRRNVSRMSPIAGAEPPRERQKRTSFGDPLTHLPMVHAPTCENAVLFLFGAVANDLGFKVRRMQAAFPDCLAVRRVGENRWEDVKVELELMSRNFAAHGHDPKGCDLIVCWEHNWPECPLEVVELRKEIARIAKIANGYPNGG
jgi:hypothetical protein